jgi:hypothetical protein
MNKPYSVLFALALPALAASQAQATQFAYSLEFSGGPVLPSGGGFTYDDSNQMFDNFLVGYEGETFDFKNAANASPAWRYSALMPYGGDLYGNFETFWYALPYPMGDTFTMEFNDPCGGCNLWITHNGVHEFTTESFGNWNQGTGFRIRSLGPGMWTPEPSSWYLSMLGTFVVVGMQKIQRGAKPKHP